jgi:hypothetical protein
VIHPIIAGELEALKQIATIKHRFYSHRPRSG